MLHKEELCDLLEARFMDVFLRADPNKENRQKNLCLEVNKKFGFPIGMISDIITQRVQLKAYTFEVLLYAIAYTMINNKEYDTNISLNRYFSEKEIELYSKYKYKEEKVTFPFTFESNMIEIRPREQYIGRTTIRELMRLRDSSVINYNANTQRSMTLKRKNKFEYYTITLNDEAIRQISDLMQQEMFVPNVLTLNLSHKCDFVYRNGKLTIKEACPFDILDGYHRYIAMSNLYNIDPSFDYPMELRIMFLSEDDAKQFIYQEDQRTPLSKANADAMNKNDNGVKVCKMIKGDVGSNIINQNGIINENVLVKLINMLWLNKGGEYYGHSRLVTISDEITAIITKALKEVPSLQDNRWTTNFTIIFFGLAAQGELKGKALYDRAMEISMALSKEENLEILNSRRLNKLLAI